MGHNWDLREVAGGIQQNILRGLPQKENFRYLPVYLLIVSSGNSWLSVSSLPISASSSSFSVFLEEGVSEESEDET